MSEQARTVLAALLALPAEEREAVTDTVRSLDELDEDEPTEDELHESWAEEINRRLEDMRSGRDPGVDAEDMFPELREDRG